MLRRSGKPARPEGRRLCSGLCRNLRKGDCAAATARLAQISGCVYTAALQHTKSVLGVMERDAVD
jgi:hypothetical protein